MELLQDIRDYLGNDYDREQESTLLFCIKRACNLRRTAATGAFASGHPAEPNGHLH